MLCLKNFVPDGICYLLPSYPLSVQWTVHTATSMYISRDPQKCDGPKLWPKYSSVSCLQLYYTGTFVVMCLNTCDRKHLQTWNTLHMLAPSTRTWTSSFITYCKTPMYLRTQRLFLTVLKRAFLYIKCNKLFLNY